MSDKTIESRTERALASSLAKVSFSLAIICSVYGIGLLVATDKVFVGTVVILITAVIFVGIAVWTSYLPSAFKLQGFLFCLVGTAVSFFASYKGGGIDGYAEPLLVLPPIMAAYFLGPRFALITWFACIGWLFALWFLGSYALVPESPLSETGVTISSYLIVVVTVTFASLAAGYSALNLKRTSAQAEESFRRALEESASKSHFLSNLSHELRTPLNGVIGLTEGLLLEEQSDRTRDALKCIAESGEQLVAVFDDILDLSKIISGKFALHEEEFQLKKLLNRTLTLFGPSASKSGIELRLDIRHSADGTYMGDPCRLQQIVNNLVSNSLKFTKNGTIKVTASSERIGANLEEHLSIQVSDTGIGVSREALERIFHPFEQALDSTANEFGGTGLGLPICKELCRLMGGSIAVSSQIGVGTNVDILLPLKKLASCEPTKSLSSDTASIFPSTEEVGNLHVLVAEDNATNQRVISTLLNAFGHSFVIANNGYEALETWRTQDFDLVFMDSLMPEMNGIECVQALRILEKKMDRRRVPIIAVSANVSSDHRKGYIEAGMDDLLPKPITARGLAQKIAANC